VETKDKFLQATEIIHKHLCPRQVLGVRMGMLAGKVFDLQLPQDDKRLLTISETDGCFVDGISVVTNCTVGHRTLRIEDYGKVAATFVDTKTEKAFRVSPRPDVRMLASKYAPSDSTKWETYLIGYQRMPDEALLCIQEIQLNFSLKQVISRAGIRTTCVLCGEEIINEREVLENGLPYCRGCMFGGYYCVKDFENEIASSTVQVLQEP
jgi:formylmethanofuran dehydrogenase subunit E